MQIDTTSILYQKYFTGLTNLRIVMAPRFALFKKLPIAKKKLWLKKDPLFRKILKMSLKVAEWAEEMKAEVEND